MRTVGFFLSLADSIFIPVTCGPVRFSFVSLLHPYPPHPPLHSPRRVSATRPKGTRRDGEVNGEGNLGPIRLLSRSSYSRSLLVSLVIQSFPSSSHTSSFTLRYALSTSSSSLPLRAKPPRSGRKGYGRMMSVAYRGELLRDLGTYRSKMDRIPDRTDRRSTCKDRMNLSIPQPFMDRWNLHHLQREPACR